MSTKNSITVHNCQPFKLKDIPLLEINDFTENVITEVERGKRISSLFGRRSTDNQIILTAVVTDDKLNCINVMSAEVENSYPSITPYCTQAHYFEREIAEQWGLVPEGHPWLKPVRFHKSFTVGQDAWNRNQNEEILPGMTNFYRVEGKEIHEVAVGPVHAGIIEPGHFRFQCHGEKVLNLEISLGYQHRGIEKALMQGAGLRTIHYMETLAGDSTIAHSLAYAQAYEAISRCGVSARSHAIRGIMLELERLANHTGDLGALAGDAAYLPTSSYCGRIRGDFLNMTALICGNRFGRNIIRPGGVKYDLDAAMIESLDNKLEAAFADVKSAVNLLWESPSVLGRFEDTGVLSKEVCEELGIVGIPARAAGVERDVRFDLPYGIYCFSQIPISFWTSGDVFARAYVRWLEIERSKAFIKEQLETIAGDSEFHMPGKLQPEAGVVSMVEGWRGEICHVAMTGVNGNIAHYKVVDPSFHNWPGLSTALRNEEISNFPLCNKSFNLSYCGHDL